MKNMLKKNQIMITALAIMIAVAGYLNFAGTKVTEEEMMMVDSDTVVNDEADTDVTALFEISEEDTLQSSGYGDIESLDTDMNTVTADYLDEGMAENVEETVPADSEVPGEAVFTSTSGMNSMSGAKLLKEQTRAKNKVELANTRLSFEEIQKTEQELS